MIRYIALKIKIEQPFPAGDCPDGGTTNFSIKRFIFIVRKLSHF